MMKGDNGKVNSNNSAVGKKAGGRFCLKAGLIGFLCVQEMKWEEALITSLFVCAFMELIWFRTATGTRRSGSV